MGRFAIFSLILNFGFQFRVIISFQVLGPLPFASSHVIIWLTGLPPPPMYVYKRLLYQFIQKNETKKHRTIQSLLWQFIIISSFLWEKTSLDWNTKTKPSFFVAYSPIDNDQCGQKVATRLCIPFRNLSNIGMHNFNNLLLSFISMHWSGKWWLNLNPIFTLLS